MVAADDDHGLASQLALEAGSLLLALREEIADADVRRTEGDRRAHEFLLGALAAARPGDSILSEEGRERLDRAAERTWIVDPLDGTREYGEGRSDWAVHVALVKGERLLAGAVSLPARELTLGTHAAVRLAPPRPGVPRVVVSRTRPPQIALAVAEGMRADLVELGSAGVKVMAVVLGEADVYLHSGGQYEWDSAAPVAVAAAAGAHCSRLDGSPLRYNQRDPWLPDLLVCRPELASSVIETIERKRR